MENKTRWQDGANLIYGAWLVASPFALKFNTVHVAAWSAYVTGAVIIICAILAFKTMPQIWIEWVFVLLAGWLLIAPFVLGFAMQADATADFVILSLLTGMSALWVLTQRPEQKTV